MGEMTAIAIQTPGGPEVLVPVKLPVPVPGPGQLLVRVKAAGVNRPDVLQRKGGYPPPPGAPSTPGLEIAGEVTGLGSGIKRYEVGDQVCALVPGGGYAEFAVVHEDNALPVPPGFSMEEAAAIPETFFTVWTNVFDRGLLKEGETILIHGGSSGIGTTAIMLAKAFGARVVVTAGSDAKCAACEKLGADLAINYRTEDFVEVLTTRGIAPEVILDMVGGDYVARNFKAAAMHARIVVIAFQQGSKMEIDLLPIMMKRLHSHWLDAPPTERFRESGDRAGAGSECVAAAGGGPMPAGHFPELPACRGCGSTRPDGIERAHRKNHFALLMR